MSALAIPITELMPLVDQTKGQAETVGECSRAERADTVTVWCIARETFGIKFKLARLARRQRRVIRKLVNCDFGTMPYDRVKGVAECIDDLVREERDLLEEINRLGSEIRFWWDSSLSIIADQVEHLDSIAESLHVETDEKASALLAMSVEQFALK